MKKITIFFLIFYFSIFAAPKRKSEQLGNVNIKEPFKIREITFVNQTDYLLWVKFRDETDEEVGFVLAYDRSFDVVVPLKQKMFVSYFLLEKEIFYSEVRETNYYNIRGIYKMSTTCSIPHHMTAKIIEISAEQDKFLIQTKTTSECNLSQYLDDKQE